MSKDHSIHHKKCRIILRNFIKIRDLYHMENIKKLIFWVYWEISNLNLINLILKLYYRFKTGLSMHALNPFNFMVLI